MVNSGGNNRENYPGQSNQKAEAVQAEKGDQKMKQTIVSCLAIVVLGGLEALALSKGINGVLFSAIAAIIGGIAGFEVKNLAQKKGK